MLVSTSLVLLDSRATHRGVRCAIGLAVGLTALSCMSCAAAPKGPRGPLQGPGAKVAIDWSVAASYATLEREGKADLAGSSDHYWTNLPLPPRRLELRLAPFSWMDVGAEIGWLDGSADVRFGVPAEPGRWFSAAWGVGVRSGQIGLVEDTKRTNGLWARSELYPLLFMRGAGRQTRQHRLALALGVDAGTFYHQLARPIEDDDVNEGVGFTATQLLREELRLESAFGYVIVTRTASALAALEPYLAFELEDRPRYRQSWGVVLVVTLSARLPFREDED